MIFGSDPQQLDHLAQRIGQRADAYEHSHQQITYWLNRLTWQGPDAYRFRAAYRSSMGPQLTHAAAALRDAASSVRSQAAHQRATSTGAAGGGLSGSALAGLAGLVGLGGVAGIAHGAKTLVELQQRLAGLGGLGGVAGIAHGAKTLGELQKRLFEYRMMKLDFFEIADFVRMAKTSDASAQLLFDKSKLGSFGAERILGSSGANALSVVGAGYAALTMPGDVIDLSEDIGEFDWSDQDSIEQFFYSGTDVMISTGSMLGVTPLAPAGLVLMSTGYVMKGGTAVLPPVVNWGVDNVVWPVWDKAGRPAWDFVSNNAQDGMSWAGDRLHDTWEFTTDAWKFVSYDAPEAIGGAVGGFTEGAGNVIRDMGQQSKRMVESAVDSFWGGVRGSLGL